MDRAVELGLVAGRPIIFAQNRMVVLLPASNPGRVEQLRDLARPGTKVVLAAEAVPAGRYAREQLERLDSAPGMPHGYARAVLANVVSYEENVRAVVARVQLGEADAGLAYRSDVTPAVAPHVRVLGIPDDWSVTAAYPVAEVAGSSEQAGARAFLKTLLGPAGRRILERHGLLAPPGP
jgi:molybdate transport system substrate-binding protein